MKITEPLVLICFMAFVEGSEKFLYFAYGSNLLARRIHINNPTAVFEDVAKLSNYRLDFNTYITSWNGAVATICPDRKHYTIGVLWSLNIEDMAHLDKQEGVDSGLYYAVNVPVLNTENRYVVARTYIQTDNPTKLEPVSQIGSKHRLPSITYKKVIVIGAKECGIPDDYIKYLNRTIVTNGRLASKELREQLGPEFID